MQLRRPMHQMLRLLSETIYKFKKVIFNQPSMASLQCAEDKPNPWSSHSDRGKPCKGTRAPTDGKAPGAPRHLWCGRSGLALELPIPPALDWLHQRSQDKTQNKHLTGGKHHMKQGPHSAVVDAVVIHQRVTLCSVGEWRRETP